jgi:hypothetical protein
VSSKLVNGIGTASNDECRSDKWLLGAQSRTLLDSLVRDSNGVRFLTQECLPPAEVVIECIGCGGCSISHLEPLNESAIRISTQPASPGLPLGSTPRRTVLKCSLSRSLWKTVHPGGDAVSEMKTTSLAAFASQLRAWRQQMNWTQVEAAGKLGYSVSLRAIPPRKPNVPALTGSLGR